MHRVELTPAPDGVVIVGENGHGKTNVLEAIYYLELLRSVRASRDQDLVRFGETGFHLSGEVEIGDCAQSIGVGFDRSSRRKRVRLDGAEMPRLSEALGRLPAVMVSPRDVSLVGGAPADRRRFLDVVLALTSRSYLASLQRYRAALVRRNAALRDVQRRGAGGAGARDDGRVAVWEPALAEHGAVLWSERSDWVERHRDEFARLCALIGEHAPAELRYATPLATREALLAALESKRALDIKRGVTHAGPHRDDIELLLDGRELRLFGSAGQQRTAAIALRMLEASTLRDHTGAAPLLLLDDPFAELDERRSARILDLLTERAGGGGRGQTILAVPRTADIPAEFTRLARLSITDGVLAPMAA